MKQIDHIGIAVNNLEDSISTFTALLNTACYKIEEVESQKVKTAFFKLKDQKIELLAATSNTSTIAQFLQRKGEGIHHIAFEVEDIVLEMERLRKEGFTPLQEHPFPGADNKLVAFFHPKTTQGVLVEICQQIKVQ
ncbi:MAG: methylmalonyl-CoA epimerase [Flavobacteriaceae bacterium]